MRVEYLKVEQIAGELGLSEETHTFFITPKPSRFQKRVDPLFQLPKFRCAGSIPVGDIAQKE
jgi:hypothetical protein